MKLNKLFTPIAMTALMAVPASAAMLLSEDFQTPSIGNNTANPAYAGWTYQNGASVKSRNESTADLPGDSNFVGTNQGLQFEWTNTRADYDLGHNWSATDEYNLTINASPQAWNIDQQRTINARLVETSGNTVIWAGSADLPTYSTATYAWNGPGPFGNSDWQSNAADTLFSWNIDASTFVSGTPGENIRIEIQSSGFRGLYFDNVNLELVDPIAIPEPSSTALLGLAGLAFVLRRRR